MDAELRLLNDREYFVDSYLSGVGCFQAASGEKPHSMTVNTIASNSVSYRSSNEQFMKTFCAKEAVLIFRFLPLGGKSHFPRMPDGLLYIGDFQVRTVGQTAEHPHKRSIRVRRRAGLRFGAF